MVRRALAPGVEIRPLPALAVVQVINIRRIVTKYRQRGYRFALIEAGLAAQTLCQMATAFGLGALMWGGFREHLLDPLLELDGVNTSSVGVIFVGHPAGS
jgi:SagB-type dehydrogenase family enzyme